MINENLIEKLKLISPEFADKLQEYNDAELEIHSKEFLINLWLELEKFKEEFIKEFYEMNETVTADLCMTVGLGNGFQTESGEVYEVVVPQGGFTFYKHIDVKTASIARSKELGFIKADKRKKS